MSSIVHRSLIRIAKGSDLGFMILRVGIRATFPNFLSLLKTTASLLVADSVFYRAVGVNNEVEITI